MQKSKALVKPSDMADKIEKKFQSILFLIEKLPSADSPQTSNNEVSLL